MTTHIGEKRHECSICKRSFSSKQYLSEHQRRHSDKKVEKMREKSGEDAGKKWRRCGKKVEKMREKSGEDAGKKWRRCGKKVEKMREKSGEDAGKKWRRCGKKVEKMREKSGEDGEEYAGKPLLTRIFK
ncbi:hypothetical protein QYM36_005137 [Artemia franciscana]|uniref:C2H2-type domain-containing protein n=2 Tax=Artemia franciscana TaxID=6661 RepID=A0AA88HYN9_ARTSF|nr:hypothetical protein QYM36_005137 [Artemia franciscana]